MSNFTLRKTSPTGNDMGTTTQGTTLRQQGFQEVNKRRTFLQDNSWIKKRPEEERDENYGRVVLHRHNSHDALDRKANEREEPKATISRYRSDDTLDRNVSTFQPPEVTKTQPGGLSNANATNTPASTSTTTPVKKKRQSWFPPPPPGYNTIPNTGASRREPTVHPPIPPKPSSAVSSPNQLKQDNRQIYPAKPSVYTEAKRSAERNTRSQDLENIVKVATSLQKTNKGEELDNLIKMNKSLNRNQGLDGLFRANLKSELTEKRAKSLENLIFVNTRTDKDGKGNQGLGSLIKVNQRADKIEKGSQDLKEVIKANATTDQTSRGSEDLDSIIKVNPKESANTSGKQDLNGLIKVNPETNKNIKRGQSLDNLIQVTPEVNRSNPSSKDLDNLIKVNPRTGKSAQGDQSLDNVIKVTLETNKTNQGSQDLDSLIKVTPSARKSSEQGLDELINVSPKAVKNTTRNQDLDKLIKVNPEILLNNQRNQDLDNLIKVNPAVIRSNQSQALDNLIQVKPSALRNTKRDQNLENLIDINSSVSKNKNERQDGQVTGSTEALISPSSRTAAYSHEARKTLSSSAETRHAGPKDTVVYTRTYMENSKSLKDGYRETVSGKYIQTVYSTSDRSVIERDMCTYCRKPLGTETKMILDELQICCHSTCFKCEICKKPLENLQAGDSIWIYRQTIHCESCYSKVVVPFHHLKFPVDTMTVTVVYDNSEATELCAAQHLYLKPIAKLMINVLLPESPEPSRPVSNWEVLDQLKSLICPDQFTTVRLAKSTRDFIRFEGEAETRSLVQILKAKLHGKIIKLNGLETDLKVMVTDAQGEWEHFPKENGATPMGDGSEEQDHDKSPNSIYFEGLPCKWFAPKGSSGEKPCEEILRVVFESFGKIKNVDIPMLDPYREVITSGSFGGFSFGLQTFEAFIQYQESTDFLKAMESLRGMKLMLKGDDGKALACNIKVMFDTTKHFSEGAIKKRNQERLKLQELEEERKKAKRREEEEAERKRKEERKVQEKRRKARVKRRTQKERDRHRQRRQKDSAKVEAQPGSNSSEDLEKRKIPLTQRQLEALYLMRALLRKIVESEEFYPRKANVAGSKAHHAPETVSGTLKKEEPNTQYLQNQEEMLRYHVSKSDYKRKRKMKKRARAHLRKSSHHLGGKKIRYSARKERAGKSLTDEYNNSLSCDQNSLQIIVTQSQYLEKEDQHGSNTSYSSRFVERDHSRKQKIYETDEFIDYLLNHYQTPEYARICLEPSHITSTCQWKRTVLVKGNSFQINLRKHKHHSSSLSQMQHLDRREQVQEDDFWTNLSWDPEHISQKKRKMDYAEECTKKFKHHFKDTASKAGDCLSPADEKSHLLEKTQAYQVQDPISTSQSQVSSSKRSADFDLKLRDFLEEISSDSECLSDNLSVNKEKKKKSVATYDSCPEKGCIDADEIITCDTEIMSSQQALYAEGKHDGEEKYSEYKLRKPGRRSTYELRCSWLEGKNNSIRNENSNSKEKEILAPQYLFDESQHHKSSARDQLDTVIGKRRQFSDSAFDHRVNYRLFQVPVTSSKSANASYLWGFPKRREIPWRSEYNWDAGKMKRREYSGDFMLNSGSYYIRHNSLERIDYRSYLRNNFTSSFYFQMF